jgi:hypothetical protein
MSAAAETNALWWAMQIAKDVDACEALLAGEAVDPSRLRSDWVEYASHFHLVRLDLAAIDLLGCRPELRKVLTETAA